jgi:hypothetical protein
VTCSPVVRRTETLMPIRREYRWFYPIDWPQLSAQFGLAVRRAGASIAVAHMAAWFFASERWSVVGRGGGYVAER